MKSRRTKQSELVFLGHPVWRTATCVYV